MITREYREVRAVDYQAALRAIGPMADSLDELFMERYDAILSPDLSVEESQPLVEMAGRHGLVVPMLIAPTSPPARRAPAWNSTCAWPSSWRPATR